MKNDYRTYSESGDSSKVSRPSLGRGEPDPVIRALINRLVDRGVHVSDIPPFIRNLAHSIAANPHMSLQEINHRMHYLGWSELELDDYTLHLIIHLLNNSSRTPEPRIPIWLEISSDIS